MLSCIAAPGLTCVFLAIILPGSMSSQNPSTPSTSPSTHSQPGQQPAPPSPVTVQPNAQNAAQGDQEPRSVRVVGMPPKDRLDYISLGTNLLLGVVGIAGVVVGVITLRKIERQTAATEVSAKAAELNAQALVNAERPWLVAEVKPDDTMPHLFHVHIANVGRSPARFISCDATHVLVERADLMTIPPDYDSPITIPAQTLIATGQGFKVPHGYSISHLLKPGEDVTLVVYGRVLYGNTIDPKQTHETRWCFGYIFVPDSMRLMKGEFVLCGPDEYTKHT